MINVTLMLVCFILLLICSSPFKNHRNRIHWKKPTEPSPLLHDFMYVRADSDALYKQKGQQVLISWKLKYAKINLYMTSLRRAKYAAPCGWSNWFLTEFWGGSRDYLQDIYSYPWKEEAEALGQYWLPWGEGAMTSWGREYSSVALPLLGTA